MNVTIEGRKRGEYLNIMDRSIPAYGPITSVDVTVTKGTQKMSVTVTVEGLKRLVKVLL